MERRILDLFELQTMLKAEVERCFPSKLWIKAEVSSMQLRGGHCYLELSQSGESGLVAKARANIWRQKYAVLAPYFESVAGAPIAEGMQILVQVQLSYSQLYGFSLNVTDIDPEYSLGVRELERQKTIERLKAEGLMNLQKGLELCALPYNLAVISAESAAGYRDFIRHLDSNPYQFRVNIELYPALMQGADCPSSIIAALEAVELSGRQYDAVLILRGGGSKLDLACFDDYGLAAHIARFGLPVLTAIGHDQDFHVCDMVAYEYVKTPTALADYILGIYEDEDAALSAYETRMRLAFGRKISAVEAQLKVLEGRIRGAFSMKLTTMEAALRVLEARISAANPRKILERGYVLALDGKGAVLKSAAGKVPGDRVSMMFSDGRLDCLVENVRK